MEPQAEAGQIFFLLGEAIPAAFVGLSQWKRDVAEFPPKSSQDSAGLDKTDCQRLIHLVLQNRILYDAACNRLCYSPCWSVSL